MRTTLWIALLVVNAGAQPPDIEGAWEGCQTELGAFVDHFYIEFNDDGSFRRVVLRDDRERPVVEELGEYRAGDGAVTLRYAANVGGLLAEQSEVVPFRVGGDTLYWGDAVSEIALVRAQAMDDGLLGTWGIVNFVDGSIAGQVIFRADGTYSLELAGVGQSGIYVRAGSGLVNWSTVADDPALVGLPAVWTKVRVDGDRLFYDIACNFTIEAVRLSATAVAQVSWGAVKRGLRPSF